MKPRDTTGPITLFMLAFALLVGATIVALMEDAPGLAGTLAIGLITMSALYIGGGHYKK